MIQDIGLYSVRVVAAIFEFCIRNAGGDECASKVLEKIYEFCKHGGAEDLRVSQISIRGVAENEES